jgi:hypothetical protein
MPDLDKLSGKGGGSFSFLWHWNWNGYEPSVMFIARDQLEQIPIQKK